MNKLKSIPAAAIVLLLGVVFTVDAENTLAAVRHGIDICLVTIIPSLFGFMVISAFIVNSGLHSYIFKPLYIIFKPFVRLNEDEFAILMLSIVGGYPVGAKLLCDYVNCNENYHNTAARRIPYMYCGSPAFIVSIVGITLYGNIKIGFLVYLSNALASVFFALLLNIGKKRTACSSAAFKSKVSQEVFINSVLSSGHALFTICLIVILFTVLIQSAETLGIFSFFHAEGKKIVATVIEISNITLFERNTKELLPVIAALTSFGGFCIITQVSAIVNGKFSLKYFYIYRIPISLLSGLLCFFFTVGTDIPIKTFAAEYKVTVSGIFNPAASVSLLIMILLLILYLAEERSVKNRRHIKSRRF